ncbi:hypothetical protein HQ571_00245 [Candidatus Kuenenbacteria bacterium]|nr:hypothetical protein [Candidatus Kuenenbacteria bacterium]
MAQTEQKLVIYVLDQDEDGNVVSSLGRNGYFREAGSGNVVTFKKLAEERWVLIRESAMGGGHVALIESNNKTFDEKTVAASAFVSLLVFERKIMT